MEAMTSFLGSLRMSSTVRWCTPKQMLFDLARDMGTVAEHEAISPRKGGKGYMSDDAMLESSSLCATWLHQQHDNGFKGKHELLRH